MSAAPAYKLRPLPDGRSRKIRDRFWPRVDRTPGHGPNGDCWLWTGSRKKVCINGRNYDYGQLGFVWPNGAHRPIGAHVCSFYLTRGRLPGKGMHVAHKCDNPPCANPHHLFEATPQENTLDAQAKGRMRVAAPKPPPVDRKIHDEFTHLQGTVSRQRIYQLRKRAKGLCMYCATAAVRPGLCPKHLAKMQVAKRENMRKRLGCARRNYNAPSYQLQAEVAA
jgi:hypothetical protein